MRFARGERRTDMELASSAGWEVAVSVAGGPDPARLVETLYRERGPQLWSFGRRLGLGPEECDDVVQEAHLRLHLALAGGTPVEDPAGWLYTVLYRLAMDRHRLARRVRDLVGRWPSAELQTTDPSLDLSVWTAIDTLPTRQRAILYLRYRADLPFERIAEVMGIEAGAARTAASRAIGRVRKLLDDGDQTGRESGGKW
jgi:RNA polymerase sigma factor (sigma-70 family)